MVLLDQLGHLEEQEGKVNPVKQESSEHRELVEPLDRLEHQGQLGQLDKLERQVLKDRLVLLDHRDSPEPRVLLVQLGHLVGQERQALQVFLEPPDHRGQPELLVPVEPQAFKDLMEPLVLQDHLAHPVVPDLLV